MEGDQQKLEVEEVSKKLQRLLSIKDEEKPKDYNRLIEDGKNCTKEGNVQKALELFKLAFSIHQTPKLQSRISEIEEFLAQSNDKDEVDEFVDLNNSGFLLYKELYDKLYDYQKDGVSFLYSLYRDGRKGGILADDMGLGKTIQVISFLSGLYEHEPVKHTLLIIPTSLITNWVKEFAKWTPGMRVKEFHGTNKVQRTMNLEKVQKRRGVVITTYTMLMNNWQQLSSFQEKEFCWDYVILDEAHKIKNPSTKTAKSAYSIPSKNRILLTGTPVQNNLREMWTLFDFACQGALLGTAKTFQTEYENPITRAREKDATPGEKALGSRMSENLMALIKPYFLRRTKSEVHKMVQGQEPTENENVKIQTNPTNSGAVMPKLTRKNDLIVWTYLSPIQEDIYRQFIALDHIKELLQSSKFPLAELTILKKVCDHPRLLSPGAEAKLYSKEKGATDTQVERSETGINTIANTPDKTLISESGKLFFLLALLERLKEEGHRTLVFAHYRKMLDIIQHILGKKGFKVLRLDGTIQQIKRQKQISLFQKDQSYSVFLLTTQVGGVGITLTAADRVVIYDPSWNPATDSQAVDRVYRIGQNKNVIIYRLITCGTLEEKIYRRQVFKDSLIRQNTGDKKNPFRYFSKQELRELFTLEDTRSSSTQLQLQTMHSRHRQTDQELDEHIAHLHTMNMFGISDHDLMFSLDANHDEVLENQEEKRTIEGRVQKAQEMMKAESELKKMNMASQTGLGWMTQVKDDNPKKFYKSNPKPNPVYPLLENVLATNHTEMTLDSSDYKKESQQNLTNQHGSGGENREQFNDLLGFNVMSQHNPTNVSRSVEEHIENARDQFISKHNNQKDSVPADVADEADISNGGPMDKSGMLKAALSLGHKDSHRQNTPESFKDTPKISSNLETDISPTQPTVDILEQSNCSSNAETSRASFDQDSSEGSFTSQSDLSESDDALDDSEADSGAADISLRGLTNLSQTSQAAESSRHKHIKVKLNASSNSETDLSLNLPSVHRQLSFLQQSNCSSDAEKSKMSSDQDSLEEDFISQLDRSGKCETLEDSDSEEQKLLFHLQMNSSFDINKSLSEDLPKQTGSICQTSDLHKSTKESILIMKKIGAADMSDSKEEERFSEEEDDKKTGKEFCSTQSSFKNLNRELIQMNQSCSGDEKHQSQSEGLVNLTTKSSPHEDSKPVITGEADISLKERKNVSGTSQDTESSRHKVIQQNTPQIFKNTLTLISLSEMNISPIPPPVDILEHSNCSSNAETSRLSFDQDSLEGSFNSQLELSERDDALEDTDSEEEVKKLLTELQINNSFDISKSLSEDLHRQSTTCQVFRTSTSESPASGSRHHQSKRSQNDTVCLQSFVQSTTEGLNIEEVSDEDIGNDVGWDGKHFCISLSDSEMISKHQNASRGESVYTQMNHSVSGEETHQSHSNGFIDLSTKFFPQQNSEDIDTGGADISLRGLTNTSRTSQAAESSEHKDIKEKVNASSNSEMDLSLNPPSVGRTCSVLHQSNCSSEAERSITCSDQDHLGEDFSSQLVSSGKNEALGNAGSEEEEQKRLSQLQMNNSVDINKSLSEHLHKKIITSCGTSDLHKSMNESIVFTKQIGAADMCDSEDEDRGEQQNDQLKNSLQVLGTSKSMPATCASPHHQYRKIQGETVFEFSPLQSTMDDLHIQGVSEKNYSNRDKQTEKDFSSTQSSFQNSNRQQVQMNQSFSGEESHQNQSKAFVDLTTKSSPHEDLKPAHTEEADISLKEVKDMSGTSQAAKPSRHNDMEQNSLGNFKYTPNVSSNSEMDVSPIQPTVDILEHLNCSNAGISRVSFDQNSLEGSFNSQSKHRESGDALGYTDSEEEVKKLLTELQINNSFDISMSLSEDLHRQSFNSCGTLDIDESPLVIGKKKVAVIYISEEEDENEELNDKFNKSCQVFRTSTSESSASGSPYHQSRRSQNDTYSLQSFVQSTTEGLNIEEVSDEVICNDVGWDGKHFCISPSDSEMISKHQNASKGESVYTQMNHSVSGEENHQSHSKGFIDLSTKFSPQQNSEDIDTGAADISLRGLTNTSRTSQAAESSEHKDIKEKLNASSNSEMDLILNPPSVGRTCSVLHQSNCSSEAERSITSSDQDCLEKDFSSQLVSSGKNEALGNANSEEEEQKRLSQLQMNNSFEINKSLSEHLHKKTITSCGTSDLHKSMDESIVFTKQIGAVDMCDSEDEDREKQQNDQLKNSLQVLGTSKPMPAACVSPHHQYRKNQGETVFVFSPLQSTMDDLHIQGVSEKNDDSNRDKQTGKDFSSTQSSFQNSNRQQVQMNQSFSGEGNHQNQSKDFGDLTIKFSPHEDLTSAHIGEADISLKEVKNMPGTSQVIESSRHKDIQKNTPGSFKHTPNKSSHSKLGVCLIPPFVNILQQSKSSINSETFTVSFDLVSLEESFNSQLEHSERDDALEDAYSEEKTRVDDISLSGLTNTSRTSQAAEYAGHKDIKKKLNTSSHSEVNLSLNPPSVGRECSVLQQSKCSSDEETSRMSSDQEFLEKDFSSQLDRSGKYEDADSEEEEQKLISQLQMNSGFDINRPLSEDPHKQKITSCGTSDIHKPMNKSFVITKKLGAAVMYDSEEEEGEEQQNGHLKNSTQVLGTSKSMPATSASPCHQYRKNQDETVFVFSPLQSIMDDLHIQGFSEEKDNSNRNKQTGKEFCSTQSSFQNSNREQIQMNQSSSVEENHQNKSKDFVNLTTKCFSHEDLKPAHTEEADISLKEVKDMSGTSRAAKHSRHNDMKQNTPGSFKDTPNISSNSEMDVSPIQPTVDILEHLNHSNAGISKVSFDQDFLEGSFNSQSKHRESGDVTLTPDSEEEVKKLLTELQINNSFDISMSLSEDLHRQSTTSCGTSDIDESPLVTGMKKIAVIYISEEEDENEEQKCNKSCQVFRTSTSESSASGSPHHQSRRSQNDTVCLQSFVQSTTEGLNIEEVSDEDICNDVGWDGKHFCISPSDSETISKHQNAFGGESVHTQMNHSVSGEENHQSHSKGFIDLSTKFSPQQNSEDIDTGAADISLRGLTNTSRTSQAAESSEHKHLKDKLNASSHSEMDLSLNPPSVGRTCSALHQSNCSSEAERSIASSDQDHLEEDFSSQLVSSGKNEALGNAYCEEEEQKRLSQLQMNNSVDINKSLSEHLHKKPITSCGTSDLHKSMDESIVFTKQIGAADMCDSEGEDGEEQQNDQLKNSLKTSKPMPETCVSPHHQYRKNQGETVFGFSSLQFAMDDLHIQGVSEKNDDSNRDKQTGKDFCSNQSSFQNPNRQQIQMNQSSSGEENHQNQSKAFVNLTTKSSPHEDSKLAHTGEPEISFTEVKDMSGTYQAAKPSRHNDREQNTPGSFKDILQQSNSTFNAETFGVSFDQPFLEGSFNLQLEHSESDDALEDTYSKEETGAADISFRGLNDISGIPQAAESSGHRDMNKTLDTSSHSEKNLSLNPPSEGRNLCVLQ